MVLATGAGAKAAAEAMAAAKMTDFMVVVKKMIDKLVRGENYGWLGWTEEDAWSRRRKAKSKKGVEVEIFAKLGVQR